MSTPVLTATPERSMAAAMASRISRDSLLYTGVQAVAFPLALANTAVLARHLSLSAFGYLAIIVFWASMLTIGLNMLVLRGIERHVWGGSEDLMDMPDSLVTRGSLRARALGTGIVLNVALAALAAVAVALNASTLCRLLLVPVSLKPAVVWMGISGGLGSIWRLTTGILRWERRRKAYSTVYVMRWVVALGLSWALLITGHGPAGVVAATAMGSLTSVLTALVLARKSHRLCIDRQAVRAIAHKNAPMMAMIVGLTILHDADVFLLSRVAPASEVGLYRLATRLTSFISYAVSAFLIAWSPLEASSLFRATYAQLGRARVRGTFVTYYTIVGTLLVLGMSVTAGPVIAVVAPRYVHSVRFVPLTSVAYLAYGFLVVVARSSEFPRRYVVYGSATCSGAAVMIVMCLTLGGPLGGIGVALGDLVGALVGVGVVTVVCVISRSRLAIEPRPVIGTLLIGALCYAIGVPLAGRHPAMHVLLSTCAIALYPALLILVGIVPTGHRAMMVNLVRELDPRGRQRTALIRRVSELPNLQQRVLLALVRDRQPVGQVARLVELSPDEVGAELVRAVRRISDTPGAGERDAELGRWLLSTDSVTSKDGVQRQIESEGTPPEEIHGVEAAFTALRSARHKEWTETMASPASRLPMAPWPLEPDVVTLLGRAVRDRVPRRGLAASEGVSEPELDRRIVGALRTLTGLPARAPLDRMIAAFLFDGSDAPPPRQLWAAGVDPIELHELELALTAMRAVPERAWRVLTAQPAVREVLASNGHAAAPAEAAARAAPPEAMAVSWVSEATGA